MLIFYFISNSDGNVKIYVNKADSQAIDGDLTGKTKNPIEFIRWDFQSNQRDVDEQ